MWALDSKKHNSPGLSLKGAKVCKRRITQFIAALLYNSDVKQWRTGSISHSPLKRVCVPGLNCYSCPAAAASCPLGALQNGFGTGGVPLFAAGLLLMFGALFGRLVCGFLCPAGLVQELLYKIKTRKVNVHENAKRLAMIRKISLAKYAVLGALCAVLPLLLYAKDGIGAPLFCKYICPAGTIEAGVPLVLLNESIRQAAGRHFLWKCAAALSFLVWSVFWFRPFCVFVCPLGAIYSLFNRIAIFGPIADSTKCNHCGACSAHCKMPVPLSISAINDRECIRCGECAKVCKTGAISWEKLGKKICRR